MNRILFCLVLFFAVVVCGCGDGTKYGWYKPGATDAQINFDCRECIKKAQIQRNIDVYDWHREAELSGRGYVPFDDTPLGSDRRCDDYNIDKCMKNKGYRWVVTKL